jgi:hypothetical protein
MDMIILGIICLILVVIGLQYLLIEYVIPFKNHMAGCLNVPRKHLESVSAWDKRVWAAYDVLSKASDAFLAEAQLHGTYEEDGRRTVWSLPKDNPAAIRYFAAKHPGVPVVELLDMVDARGLLDIDKGKP